MQPTYLLVTLLMFVNLNILAQKRHLSLDSLDKWPRVEYPQISSDGKFCSYWEINTPGCYTPTLVVRKIDLKAEYRFCNAELHSNTFSKTGNFLLVRTNNDSLIILNLHRSTIVYKQNVAFFQIANTSHADNVIIGYKDVNKTLALIDAETGSLAFQTNRVKSHAFSLNGEALYVSRENNYGGLEIVTYNIREKKITTVWSGLQATNIIINKTGTAISFIEEDSSHTTRYIRHYGKNNHLSFAPLEDIPAPSKLNNFIELDSFSADGKYIYIKELLFPDSNTKLNDALPDVWSYNDVVLQSEQKVQNQRPIEIRYIFKVLSNKYVFCQQQNETIFANNGTNILTFRVVVAENKDTSGLSKLQRIRCRQYNLLNSEQSDFEEFENVYPALSPLNDYVVFYNDQLHDFFSLKLSNKKLTNITSGKLYDNAHYQDDFIGKKSIYSIAGWTSDKLHIIIQGPHDLFKVSLDGSREPFNITNNYGLKNNIALSLLSSMCQGNVIQSAKEFILIGFNYCSKENGFFIKDLNKKGDPKLLVMHSNVYNIPGNPYIPVNANFEPIKASNKDAFIVQRMNSHENPNFYYTKDFLRFKKISAVHPELTFELNAATLIKFNVGTEQIAGILYTPEKLDSSRKYPVIIHYYEKKSDGLNAFIRPDLSYDDINIPWFVSNGFLVFDVDILYEEGKIGKSATQSVEAAYHALAGISFVDTLKIGLQGFSFGGYETNYIISHSNLFAAAMSGAGMTDLTSFAYSINKESGRWTNIGGRFYPGPELHQNKDYFIENSPIFYSSHINTPLLMMNNYQDRAVDFTQSMELFLALRQQRKPVWLLQYDQGGHYVDGESARDYTIRITQFFNHFLKGYLPPAWMGDGIPANLKGKYSGLEIDLNR